MATVHNNFFFVDLFVEASICLTQQLTEKDPFFSFSSKPDISKYKIFLV